MPQELEQLCRAFADRYQIKRELGRGGMAIVYLAQDLKHQRQVAIKVLRPELAAGLGPERFAREIAITAGLGHPNILTLIDSGGAGGFVYYVLPFVEGESLRRRLEREKQLPIDEVLKICREIADALSHAHDRGIIHRDIKPENILLQSGHAVVSDFGIARAVLAAGGDTVTGTGFAVGTPAYMSPEQASGDQLLDARSDIYSLGCVAYEMLAGSPPFTGATPAAILARKCLDSPPSLRIVRRAVPVAIEYAVMKALSPTPADRFATASQFVDALDRAQASASRQPSRRPLAARRAALVGLSLVIAVTGAAWWRAATFRVPLDSLAVLPFDNLSGDPQQAYFVDEVREAISGELAQVKAIRVIAPWSSLRYRNSEKSIPAIARELGVSALVLGSVYRVNDSARIQVRLVQAVPRERLLWSGKFDGNLGNVRNLQRNAARRIAEGIQVSLEPEESMRLARAQPVDPEAYLEYARGRSAWNAFAADSIRKAIRHFENAIEKAPTYALAYAGLADAYRVLPYYAPVDPKEAFPMAIKAANQALELDSNLSEPHTTLGWTSAAYRGDWSGAEQHFRRGLELVPNDAAGRMAFAHFLGWEGRFPEARDQDLAARQLDPLSPRIMAHLGLVYHFERRYDQAIQVFKETLELYPSFARARWDLGRAHLEKGEYEDAIAQFKQAAAGPGQSTGGSATSIAELARALAKAGRRAEALKIVHDLEAERTRGYRSSLNIAQAYIALDERERAFEWLEKAYESRDADLILLKVLPAYDPVRSDPRFRDLLRKVGFPE